MKINSIKTKLVLAFSALIIVACTVTALFGVSTGRQLITKQAQETIQLLSEEGAKLTESRVETYKTELVMIAQQDTILSMDLATQLPALKKELGFVDYLALAIVAPDGTATYTDDTTSNLGDRAYIQKALKGEANISDVIISKVTGEPVIMVAAPIKGLSVKESSVIPGVVIGRRDGNTLSDITNDIGYGEHGYAYMINDKGQIIAHPNKELVLSQFNPIEAAAEDSGIQSLADAVQYMLDNGSGFISYDYEGKSLYAGFHKIEGTSWTIVVTADKKEVLSKVDTLQGIMNITIAISLVIGIAATYLIGSSLVKSIIRISKISDKIAALDISEDVPEKLLKKKDENGVLARAMQNITESLRNIINEITDSSIQVSSTAQELTATAEQSATASEEVSNTVEEIAKGATDQAENTERGSMQGLKLGSIIEQNREYLFNMNKASEKITGVVSDGLKDISRLTEISRENSTATKEIYDIILKTNESASQIGEASNVIASIADQTNLLSLNASIEAARAGEAGKGFAVVASEIKKLAGQSAASTNHIDGIVRDLQAIVEKAVNSMERVNEISKEQAHSVNNTKTKYESIMGAVEESGNAINLLNASEEEMMLAKNDIMDMLQTLSAIAEENAASTEEASSAMVEQSASMDEIAKSSERLAMLALSLQEIILRFKVSDKTSENKEAETRE